MDLVNPPVGERLASRVGTALTEEADGLFKALAALKHDDHVVTKDELGDDKLFASLDYDGNQQVTLDEWHYSILLLSLTNPNSNANYDPNSS